MRISRTYINATLAFTACCDNSDLLHRIRMGSPKMVGVTIMTTGGPTTRMRKITTTAKAGVVAAVVAKSTSGQGPGRTKTEVDHATLGAEAAAAASANTRKPTRGAALIVQSHHTRPKRAKSTTGQFS